MKERLLSARCPIHGAEHFKGLGCEWYNDILREQKSRKRTRKKSRQVAKKLEREIES